MFVIFFHSSERIVEYDDCLFERESMLEKVDMGFVFIPFNQHISVYTLMFARYSM